MRVLFARISWMTWYKGDQNDPPLSQMSFVKERQGHPILLRDVASVEDGMADPTTRANVSGKPTVLLPIRRQAGVNTVAMVDAVNERLGEVKEDHATG